MKILQRMLMVLAMFCFVATAAFAQKQQDPKNPPPKGNDQTRVKVEEKNPPRGNDGDRGNDNRGKKP